MDPIDIPKLREYGVDYSEQLYQKALTYLDGIPNSGVKITRESPLRGGSEKIVVRMTFKPRQSLTQTTYTLRPEEVCALAFYKWYGR